MTREFLFRIRRAPRAAALLLAGSGLLGLGPSAAAQMWPCSAPSWVGTNCYAETNTTYNYNMSHWKRSQARSYAYTGASEGYQWAGGCWNNNDTHETRYQPTSCSNSTTAHCGEGPDCSGFTFKAWAMRQPFGATGFRYWNALTNVHGPYIAESFYNGAGPTTVLPNKNRSTTFYMDAFARIGHIGMLYTSEPTSNNQDTIIEANSEQVGTVIATRPYRGQSAYRAIRRDNWTADCYPQCI